MEKPASQLRMEEELRRLESEAERRVMNIPSPRFEILKKRTKVETIQPAVKYIYDKKNFIFSDDANTLVKYSNPKIKALLDNIITDHITTFSQSSWTSVPNQELGIVPAHEWVPIELPLYVGQKHDSEVMELIQQIYIHHGDDDTGSLYKVQDAFDGFVNSSSNAGMIPTPVVTKVFQFWLKLPNENHANILASWPRDKSAIGSCVTIHVTARVASMFFIGYDFEQSDCGTPLRVRLHIKCQRGCANHVESVLAPLLKENGTFYVVGAADLADDYHVETFEVSKLGFVDVLSGQEQILLN
jgi:hypothetical protein